MTTTYYTQEIKTPKNRKEGLQNWIQLIINLLEAGNSNEALLQAVDLLNDVRCGAYNDLDGKAGNLMATLHAELNAKHAAEIAMAREDAFSAGQTHARTEIAKRLGLMA